MQVDHKKLPFGYGHSERFKVTTKNGRKILCTHNQLSGIITATTSQSQNEKKKSEI